MRALAALIADNEAARRASEDDAARARLRAWQRARLARTYADLAALPRYAAAVAFFLDELYGGVDTAPRNRELGRAARVLERLLPGAALLALKRAIDLEIETQRLDAALAAALPPDAPLTAATYAEAYRSSAPRAAREAQLAAILDLGTTLDRLVRHRAIAVLVHLAHGPAHAAGVGALHDFLERGFAAFRATGGAREFLAVIGERESQLLARLYAGDPRALEGISP